MGKRGKRGGGKSKSAAASSAVDDDDDALLEAAIQQNKELAVQKEAARNRAYIEQEMQVHMQRELKEAEEQLKEGMMNRNEFNALQQAATKTLIPGQPVPRVIKQALQRALEEIEREDAAMGRSAICGPNGSAEVSGSGALVLYSGY